ncbi:MAG: hypothetical protein ABIQ44_15250 [Chloroflexia bacterium]
MKQVRMVLWTILLVAALAACDSGGAPTATPTATTVVPTTTGTLFMLDTSGTIAGIHQLFKIDEARHAKFSDGSNPVKTGTITEKQFADLMAQVTKADFFNLKPDYDSGGVADDKYYTVTVKQGTQAKSITVAEIGGKDLTPQALSDLIAMLVAVEDGTK